MSWTLESGPCPQCETENSKHINSCHSCGAALPWAGTEMTQTEAFKSVGVVDPAEVSRVHIPPKVRVLMVMAGVTIFVGGIFLWCGNVFGFHPTFSGAGYLTMLVGGTLFKVGHGLG